MAEGVQDSLTADEDWASPRTDTSLAARVAGERDLLLACYHIALLDDDRARIDDAVTVLGIFANDTTSISAGFATRLLSQLEQVVPERTPER